MAGGVSRQMVSKVGCCVALLYSSSWEFFMDLVDDVSDRGCDTDVDVMLFPCEVCDNHFPVVWCVCVARKVQFGCTVRCASASYTVCTLPPIRDVKNHVRIGTLNSAK